MRDLFHFLWKNNFSILFLLLESLSFYLLFQNNRYHSTVWFNSSNQLTAEVMNSLNSVTQYLSLRSSNRKLAEENAQLKNFITSIKTSNPDSLMMQDSTGQYIFYPAQVINNSYTYRNNYLTLNKGSLDGVQPEMGVIAPDGIVGIIKDVSPHYSTVLSVLHKKTRISAGFKNNKFFGSLSWPGLKYNEGLLSDVARHVKFQKGDTIVTTGFSTLFPEGIMVGTVKSWDTRAGSSFYSITVEFSTDFANLTWVYIVNNLRQKEILELESQSLNNDN
ncbi:MAG: rod shape-determining protein MreC [Bacteroidia bacterium]|nr:rod shape-determining protein MreC [Bacteroidia bacterium]MCZ2277913.1 rod shape-determining protein MreC [Bacteroidia bacterium]